MRARLSIIGMAVIVLLAMFVTANHAAIRETSTQMEIPSVKGDFKVFYEMLAIGEEKPITASELPCSVIEFHPQYLVLKFRQSGGRMLPVSQISTFRWEGK